MRKMGSFGVNSDTLVTFYDAVIYSIMFGSSVNISKLDRGRLEKIVKKKAGHVWESHWSVLRLYTKRDCTEN